MAGQPTASQLSQSLQKSYTHLRITARRRRSEFGHQGGQLARIAARQQRRHLSRSPFPDQHPQRRGERRERQARSTQVHASPGQHQRPAPHPGGEVGHQPRLTAAGLRVDQHHLRTPASRSLQRIVQHASLGLTTDEHRADLASGHTHRMPAGSGNRAPRSGL